MHIFQMYWISPHHARHTKKRTSDMKTQLFSRGLLGGFAALATLAITASAQAELVSYDFTADVTFADDAELALLGLDGVSEVSGSFSYDSEAGWWGGSDAYADSGLFLSLDQWDPTITSAGVSASGETFEVRNSNETEGVPGRMILTINGQSIGYSGDLPTSLSLDEGSDNLLKIFLGNDDNKEDLIATLTSLTVSGTAKALGVSTPELDPASGSAALVLLLGGAALMGGRRRKTALTAL